MEQIHEYTIKLIRYVLSGAVPELPDKIDFEQLFEFSQDHGIENMIYIGLRDLNIEVPEQTMVKFREIYNGVIVLEAMQTIELEEMSTAFDEAEIDHVILKGSVVKYLYSMPDYRKSGDIDILIRKEDQEKIDHVMKGLGYDRENDEDEHEVHFSYIKPPIIEVEIHRQLARLDDRSYKFCSKVWNYVVLQENRSHSYIMNNEYLYMYLMAHLCKHLYLGGAGIRLIADFYVMKQKMQLDDRVLNEYLKKANLTDLNAMVVKLVKRWFEGETVADKDIDVLERIVITSGSFGTKEIRNTMLSSNTEINKVKKFMIRLFPPVRVLKGRYPFLVKAPALLPLMWIVRVFHIGLFERNTISAKVSESFDDQYRDDDLERIVKAVRDNA